eukprot:635816-Prorocentrum_minimum.AAC.1
MTKSRTTPVSPVCRAARSCASCETPAAAILEVPTAVLVPPLALTVVCGLFAQRVRACAGGGSHRHNELNKGACPPTQIIVPSSTLKSDW